MTQVHHYNEAPQRGMLWHQLALTAVGFGPTLATRRLQLSSCGGSRPHVWLRSRRVHLSPNFGCPEDSVERWPETSLGLAGALCRTSQAPLSLNQQAPLREISMLILSIAQKQLAFGVWQYGFCSFEAWQ